jgi:hypothetical protein
VEINGIPVEGVYCSSCGFIHPPVKEGESCSVRAPQLKPEDKSCNGCVCRSVCVIWKDFFNMIIKHNLYFYDEDFEGVTFYSQYCKLMPRFCKHYKLLEKDK